MVATNGVVASLDPIAQGALNASSSRARYPRTFDHAECAKAYASEIRADGKPVSLMDLAFRYDKNVSSIRQAILNQGVSMRPGRAGRPRKTNADRSKVAELAKSGKVDREVAASLGISRSAARNARVHSGVAANGRPPVSKEALALSRAHAIMASLLLGSAPFCSRDLQRRFDSCTSVEAARVMQALAKIGATVVFEPCEGPGGVRLVATLGEARP